MGSNLAGVLSNPIVAFGLRAALGAYIVWMARSFYADPLGYFRKWMPRMLEQPWMRPAIRGGAVFCIWGGCFILAAAIAAQIFDLHGWPLAIALVMLAAVATYFLLPAEVPPAVGDPSGDETARRIK
jgi:hypothetical protein